MHPVFNKIRLHCRRLATSAAAFGFWLMTVVPAFAQTAEDAEPQGKSWVFGYLLTVLVVALGLVVVCRPRFRASNED